MQSILELEDVQLVDVRTPLEHDEIRIANSQNIDYMSPTFDEDINKLDKNKPVILYCKSGGRSAKCAKKLKDAGLKTLNRTICSVFLCLNIFVFILKVFIN